MSSTRRHGWHRLLLVVLASISLAACSTTPERLRSDAPLPAATGIALEDVPPPANEIVAAVYAFPDLTGQYRETEAGYAHYSRAITQGGTAVLIEALMSVGGGEWFRVVERSRLNNVLTERQTIREQRQGARDNEGNPLPPPQPLLYAGVVFTGGIIGYDTNYITGGAGARFLGIGASTEYREDVVTVYLRAVSSQTGEVWNNVVTSERIYSVLVRADVFRFINADELLEVEVGVSRNGPRLLALREGVVRAGVTMVMEGADLNLWSFAEEAEPRDDG